MIMTCRDSSDNLSANLMHSLKILKATLLRLRTDLKLLIEQPSSSFAFKMPIMRKVASAWHMCRGCSDIYHRGNRINLINLYINWVPAGLAIYSPTMLYIHICWWSRSEVHNAIGRTCDKVENHYVDGILGARPSKMLPSINQLGGWRSCWQNDIQAAAKHSGPGVVSFYQFTGAWTLVHSDLKDVARKHDRVW